MKPDKKNLIYLILGFIFATIIGTLSHELGHYIVAKYFGFNARINYAHTLWTNPNPKDINSSSHYFWLNLAGPLETMLTGTIGLIFLMLNYKKYKATTILTFGQWILVFITLFWLRQTVNFICWIGYYLFTGNLLTTSDEIAFALDLNLPIWLATSITAIIGAAILGIVIFKFIPLSQRKTFIISGLIGGVLGYVLWLIILGPIIMP